MVSIMLWIYAKVMMLSPQIIYPTLINALRFPTLSDTAPIMIVVSAAVTALAMTIADMSAAVAWNIL